MRRRNRIVDGLRLIEQFGNSADALLSFGDSLGAVYKGKFKSSEGGQATIDLVLSPIKSPTCVTVISIIDRGMPWLEYKERKKYILITRLRPKLRIVY